MGDVDELFDPASDGGGNLEILLSAITAAEEHELADDGLIEEAIEGAVKEFGAARD